VGLFFEASPRRKARRLPKGEPNRIWIFFNGQLRGRTVIAARQANGNNTPLSPNFQVPFLPQIISFFGTDWVGSIMMNNLVGPGCEITNEHFVL
jgi:hypothetical protein